MSKKYISIPVVLGEKSFNKFLTFDVMKRQRLWKKSISLAICFYMIATICFAYQDTYDWAGIVGSIFVVFTVLLPTNYFRSFHKSAKEQTKKMNLLTPRLVYTIHLSSNINGISYYYPDEKEPAGIYEWDCVTGVWRTDDAIYLYVTDNQALLIPDNNKKQDFEAIWAMIKNHLDTPRIHAKKNQL